MQNEKQKMKEFLDKLWQNPAILKTSMGKKENQILSFLRENQAQLQKVFASADYFPNMSWNEAVALLLSELIEKVLEAISPRLERIKQNLLQSDLIQQFDPNADIDSEAFKQFLVAMMKNKPVRDQYIIVFEMISLEYFERYLPLAFEKRKTIFTEVIRRERLDIDINLVPKYINLVSLFRPLYYLKFPYKKGLDQLISLSEAQKDKKLYEQALNGMREYIQDELGVLPEKIFKPGFESFLSATDNPDISGVSRLINIMANRCMDFDPSVKADRGAESPDKSWFNINRRNAKNFGYDIRFLEELYQIAGDKGW
jgi:hypothetical protein